MKVRRGGIYILKDNYYEIGDILKDKRPIVVLNVEKNDSFFSAVRMGVFKSFTDDLNKVFIEFKIKGAKYFTAILCDKELEFHKDAIKEEIGTIDEKTLNIIEDKLFKSNYALAKQIKFNEVNKSGSGKNKIENETKEVIVQADVIVKDDDELKKVIFNTNEVVTFLRDEKIKQEEKEKKQKRYRWILVILSNVSSFILGVFASYAANHLDNEISGLFEKVRTFIIIIIESAF